MSIRSIRILLLLLSYLFLSGCANNNDEKNEAEHKHHDFRYLLKMKTDMIIELDKTEVSSFRWIDINNREIISQKLYDRIKPFL